MLKRIILNAALAALLATVAHANTDYWVDANIGSDANDGLGASATSAWQTIAKANANMVAPNTSNGHVILHIATGTYHDFPNPAASPLNGNRFLYLGHPASPGDIQILVTAASLSKTYVTIAGVTGIGTLTVTQAALFDSVRQCVFNGSLTVRGNSNVVFASTFKGAHLFHGTSGGPRARANVVESCTFPTLGANLCNQATDGGDAIDFWLSDSCFVRRNRFTVTAPQNCACGSDNVQPMQLYGVTYSSFKYNSWTVTNEDPCPQGHQYALNQRDSSGFNSFISDTFLVSGQAWNRIEFTNPSTAKSVSGTRFDSSFVKINGSVLFSDGMRGTTLSYNAIASAGVGNYALKNSSASAYAEAVGPVLIDHNTFLGDGSGGVVSLQAGGILASPFAALDTLKFTNNIVYATGQVANLPNSDNGANGWRYAAYFGTVEKFDSTFAQHYGTVSCDSTVTTAASDSHLLSNHNLFSYYGSTGTPGLGDRAVSWLKAGATRQSSGGGSSTLWDCKLAQDSGSLYGSPMFYDSTFANFDPRPQVGSAAVALCVDCGDAGAIAYAAYPLAQLSATEVAFEHGISQTKTVRLTNAGGADLTVTSIVSSDPAVAVSPSSATVSAASDQTITIAYTSTAREVTEAVLTITSNARGATVQTIHVSLGGAISIQ
jgi:hypothetical protein